MYISMNSALPCAQPGVVNTSVANGNFNVLEPKGSISGIIPLPDIIALPPKRIFHSRSSSSVYPNWLEFLIVRVAGSPAVEKIAIDWHCFLISR